MMEMRKKEAVEEMLQKLKTEGARALEEACNVSYDSEDSEDPEAKRLELIMKNRSMVNLIWYASSSKLYHCAFC